jgi:small subunit ribosomal protein S18
MLRTFTGRRLLSTTTRLSNTGAFGIMSEKPTGTTAPRQDTKLIASVTRQFPQNSLYDPFDFSMAKIRLDRKQARQNISMKAFDEKKLNPLDFYLNTRYLSQYVSSTGRILPREVTKLSVKNQKRLAKAIKRARAVGMLSSVHKDVTDLVHK